MFMVIAGADKCLQGDRQGIMVSIKSYEEHER